ncbi:hypothetical protein [Roseomonas sp. AR75]|uniref:hypothetical protein n=1 Tax=Roseomonas sp. AR75 TaxID=2562311 RepID=UPI0010C09062|nr:hypothetical protein [Roseomonas sp. AR75]
MPPERSGRLSSLAVPPYRAQWESADLVAEFLAGRDRATDPLWPRSGAADAAEYALWADHLCGCACLQMVLGARGRAMPPIHEVRRAAQESGGYVVGPDGAIRGLIYAGAVAWLQAQGIAARVVLDLPENGIAPLLSAGGLFIASVHGAIRWPEREPPRRGGHLVLVFGVDTAGRLRFHNPSGDTAETRADARLLPERFGRFFAGRGIHIA